MYDIVIIGAGIIGLSTAYQILQSTPDKKLLLIEKENKVSMHQTGHNSGVIHPGIYYKPESLKAKNCRYGIKLLKHFCNIYEIKYEICGKIIIASTNSDLNVLNMLFERGKANGIQGLRIIQKNEIPDYEPYAIGEKAIFCPETGIVNYSDICKKLYELINKKGKVITGERVSNITDKQLRV